MHISTSLMYRQVTQTLLDGEASMGRLVEQMSTGRRILTPADDPLGASLSVNVAQAMAMNATYANNRATAEQRLTQQESTLGSITLTMQDVLTRLTEAANGAYSDTDRATLADVLRKSRDALVGLANTADGNGQYIFSGYDGDKAPYGAEGDYLIDAGRNNVPGVQIDANRTLPIGEVGSNIFARANPGSGGHIISSSTTVDSTAEFGAVRLGSSGTNQPSTQVRFVDVNGTLSYEVTTLANPPVAPVTRPYVAGEALALGNGTTLAVKGEPKIGDAVNVMRTQEAGVDIFKALNEVITALETPIENDPVAAAKLSNAMATASQTLHNGYNNILTVRAATGSGLQEIESLEAVGVDRQLAYSKQLSGIEDANVVTLMSELVQRQTALQAAGMAFQAIQSINLFNK